MSTLALKTNITMDDYGKGIKKLLLDISEEIKNNIKDGIGMQIASQNGDEASVYNFIKKQGYEVNYKDFLAFHKDGMKMVNENEEAIKMMLEEQKTEELSDSDLEQVAGGMGWLGWLLIGIGAALVIAAVTIITCGVGTAVMASIGASVAAGGAGLAATAAVGATFAAASTAGYVAAVVGAVGIGGIMAGVATQ
jgi:hypothetical protein